MRLGRHITAVLAAVLTVTAGVSLSAQRQGRFLAKEDIILLGLGLRVEPAHQTVPKDIATIVSTFLQSSTQPGAEAPPFAPGAVIKGTLRGPSFAAPMDIETAPNTPFNIPPLGVKGLHTLDNIRLVSGNEVIMFGSPESVTIEVIEKLLVTQVTSRPLSAAEIREKGIVFDKSNFQAYNFTAAFAVQDTPINLTFPILLPRLEGAEAAGPSAAELASVDPPPLPSLKTIIPDTLRVQTQIPNLSVVGFALTLELPAGSELLSFPIPGVIVVPGNIGFLNQMFSVMLMVGNVAPGGSNLVVTDLKAEVVLPAGADTVAGSVDDPLRMAQTVSGEAPRVKPLVQPGADGVPGTNDDIQSLAPGESSSAEYLIEGRREGTHVIEMEISGTLNGLPVGPVPVRGRAAGSVLVRNPSFTLTFTHPEVVTAGEAYALDITITNTSASPANFVSLNLHAHNISGAALTGSNTREVDSIPPGDSATVSFDLVSKVTGKVTAATLDSDENVAGRFGLKTAVGELGVPLSPDSLILPKEARSLPKPLLDAAVGLLGKAWAVATAPAGALPADVSRFSKQIVFDRAVEVAEAGFRVRLHEPVAESAAQLAMDFLGSNLSRLPEISPAGNAPLTAIDYAGFDGLRRSSIRGDIFARAVADLLRDDLTSQGVGSFHRQLAEKLSYRPGHIAVLIGSSGGALPVRVSMADGQGRRLGGSAPSGKIIKEIPFGDHLEFRDDAGAAIGQLAIVAAPQPGQFVVRIEPVPGAPEAATFDLSVVIPDAAGRLSQVMYQGLTIRSTPAFANGPGAPFTITFANAAGTAAPAAVSVEPIADPAPRLIGVVQQKDADRISCKPEGPFFFPGRIIAVLFSEEVTAASAQDKLDALDLTRYGVDGNKVVGVALQPGRRIAFIALRDGIGPYLPRSLTVEGVTDRSGQPMASQTLAIESTVTAPGGVVSGQVIEADGTPVAANVRLFFYIPCGVGISAKNTGGDGRFSWDYVLGDPVAAGITGVNLQTETHRSARFAVQRDGQRLNVNIVLLGRGTLRGRTLAEDGTPLAGTKVRVTSLTDQSQYGATTDAGGAFAIGGIPVGNLFVEAVNVARNAQVNLSEHIPVAGGTTVKDIVLLDIDMTRLTVKTGALSGHVLRADGATPVAGIPVIVYYTHNSQPGVKCPPLRSEQLTGKLNECPIAIGTTDDAGGFAFGEISAGALRVETFDQVTLQQGDAGVVLAADGKASVTVLLGAGLGTVNGIVLDASGQPVAGARVGGGLSLTTSDAAGAFVLRDVPVGRREIVAVSDQLAATTKVVIDIVRAGEEVNATLRFPGQGSIAGTIFAAGGVTPVPNLKVYLVTGCPGGGGGVCVVATAITNATGGYRMDGIPLGRYTFSAFYSGLSDGNVAQVDVKFNGQVVRTDVTFRGGGGQITGRVFDDDGVTPLKARVAISGDRVISAGGIVGLGFQHVRNYAITDTNFTTGQFNFGGVLVGDLSLSAVGPFSPDPVTISGVMPSAGATVEMNLRLQPTSSLTGIVTQPDGVTPAGPNVIVRFKSNEERIICGALGCVSIPQGIQEEIVITDADSRYLVPLVNAGTFTLTAEDPASGRTAQVQGIVRAGDTGEVPIRLTRVATVRVEVRGSDTVTPIPGARVEVAQLEYPKKKLTFFANVDGVVTFGGADGFSEGDLVVLATDLGTGFAGRAPARVTSEDDQVDVKVYLFDSTGTVEGTVFRSDGLTPVPFADVIISNCVDDGFGGCTSGGTLAFAVTDAVGHYEQSQIPEGDFTVEVFEAATARRGFQRGRIDRPGQVVGINVVEAALGQVSGALLQSGNLAPIKGGRVWLSQRAPSGRQLPTLNGTSSVDGSFAFPGVSVGTFTISARVTKPEPGGFADASGAIVREGELVDIPIVVNIARPAFGTIAGIVRNPDGTPGALSRIEICHADMDCSIPRLLTAEADGTFSLPNVPLGRFSINARSQVDTNTGSLLGELVFENEVTSLTVVLAGLRRITGTVFHSNGIDVAPLVEVILTGLPQSGCASACTRFADQAGNFTFEGVPAEIFTITARDQVTGLRGVTGGSLAPSESKIVRVVLQASGGVSGRVLFADSRPAAHVIAALTPLAPQGGFGFEPLFTETDANGHFAFVGVPVGPFRLELEDPLGSGIARRTATVAGDTLLGDIVLDEAAPSVQSMTPAASAVGVPQATAVQLVFSEPIDQGTINTQNVILSGPNGVVTGVLAVSANDTTVTLTPLAVLKTETRYSLRIKGVKDRLGKTMTAEFVAGFTTIDITAPSALDISPAPGTNGISVDSPFRVRFSEPIDPSRLRGPPVILSTTGGTVDGRFDLLFGNTVAVFTPLRPLSRGATYQVDLSSVTDLSGNAQPGGLVYSFSTTDGTAPEIVALSASNNGSVIEGSVAAVTADVGVTHDVAIVDFYANGVLVAGDRSAPFELRLQATPAFGGPGDSITITALATDTSGNRGRTPAQVLVAIVADQPPSIAITSPASGLSARNGDRIVVTARGIDDLGVVQLGFRAQTGKPQDAANRPIVPVVTDRSEEFVFFVPQDAPPGSTIRIDASAVDTKGQVGAAPAVELVVLDAVPPTITITGLATGARVRPGQQATAIVSASDVGHIASITFGASGVTAFAQTRVLDPTQPAVFASFSFGIPATARPGEFINLDASAVDKAGNVTNAARVILPIADLTPPTIQLRTSSGRLEMVPGREVRVIAEVEDEIGVTRVDLIGSGAFSLSDTRQISPPLGSAEAVFTINVPAGIAEGAVLNLQATATDIAGNVSDATILSLTATTLSDIIMPPSVIVMAGETRDITVELSTPAPAGGLRVDFASRNSDIAVVAPSVLFAEGELSRTVAITGVAGGVVSIDALVQGVQRATMTTTVRGGIVRGQVLMVVNANLLPVPNAQVTLSDGQTNVTTTADGSGEFLFDGYPWFGFTLRALDPESGFRGFVSGTMSRQNGFAEVNIVLIPAGVIRGTVLQPDGVTLAGAGVRVDIFASGNFQPIGTTFTDAAGAYEFPLVALGNYVIDATAADGNRGRASAALTTSAEIDVPITYLGRGTVTITVRDGSDNPVPNAAITFTTRTVFGYQPPIRVNAEADGIVRFEHVMVGDFQVEARDTVSFAAGTAAGAVTSHLQDVQAVVKVGSYGALEGTVYRPDGITPVPNARVTAGGSFGFFTTTDENGRYRFEFLRLGFMQVDASDEPTRGRGRAMAHLVTNGATVTQNIVFVGQGTIVATVTNAVGTPVRGAIVEIRTNNPTVGGDSLYGFTGDDGTLLLEHVLVGPFTALAWSNGLFITQTGTLLQNGEVLPLLLRLQPTGTIKGTVYAPDGQTPMTSGTVYANDATDSFFNHYFPMGQSAIGADGTYTLADLRFYNYNLSVRDTQGRLRAITRNVVISSLGQVETRDMTFVGLGSVNGRVVFEGASAPNLAVEVRSLTPTFGGAVTVQTNAGGFYQADNVVVGNIAVSTGDASRQLLGEAQGRLERDGDTLTLDVLLQNNATTLPQTKFDANNNYYQVQRDARLQGSGGDLFSKTFGDTQGGLVLDLVTDTATTRVTGAAIGTVEELGREIVVRQQSVAGLNVTRKVFLPRTGYFARYLEVVSNPTANPIAVAVRVTSILPRDNYELVRTSSGDTALDVADPATRDRWVVFDDPAGAQHPMSAAFVFDGVDGAQRVGTLSVQPNPDPNCFSFTACWSQRLAYTWNSVTLAPGESIAYVHFIAHQIRKASALASAERLAQLPPEALAGLSAAEMAQIQNFAVPEGGNSALAPLPSLFGTVTGRLFEGDGVTPVPSVVQGVRFTTTSQYYDGNYLINTDGLGRFTLTSSLVDFASNVVVPAEGFTIRGNRHPVTNIQGPAVAGAFAPDTLIVEQDVAFSNAGLLSGVVRRQNGTPVTTGSLTAFGPGYFAQFVPIASDGSYRIGGLLAGPVSVTVFVPHQQGSALSSVTVVPIAAGQLTTTDLLLPPTGAVTGIVRTATGSVATNLQVQLLGSGFTRSTISDSAGLYLLSDVPAGTYQIQVREPTTNVATVATITVAADQTSTQHMQLVGTGRVQVQAFYAGGAPFAGVAVVRDTTGAFVASRQLDAAGRATFDAVPVGAFKVTINHPLVFGATVEALGTITTHGETVPVSLTLPPVGSVRVQVNFAGGAPAANASVELQHKTLFLNVVGQTNASGILVVPSVVGPAFAARARHPIDFGYSALVNGTLTTEAQQAQVTLTLPPVGAVSVQVNSTAGVALPGIRVDVQDDSNTSFRFGGFTDAAGLVTIPRVRAAFVVQAYDSADSRLNRFGSGRIDTEGQVVPVTIVLGARGTVTGRVLQPTGAPMMVEVLSENPSFSSSVWTGADGHFSVADVAVGNFRARISDSATGRAGWTYGSLAQHGDTATADLDLAHALLYATFSDANGYNYAIGTSGEVTQRFFPGAFSDSNTLGVGSGSTSWFMGNQSFFRGDFAATWELDRRQVSIANTAPFGGFPIAPGNLKITRKVYVPSSGYFARYLEVFENVGATPLTTDTVIRGSFAYGAFAARVAATSSGDTTFDAGDRWVIVNDPASTIRPAGLLVLGGDGASKSLADAGLIDAQRDKPWMRWNGLTIAPGQRVILMHFAVQQANVAAAQASAERLVQLPPEALHGLTADERATIVNFAVPLDGSSPVAPFATLRGRVLAGDASPVPGAVVTVTNPGGIFSGNTVATTNAQGEYSLSTLTPGAFEARARHPLTNALTLPVSGVVGPADTTVEQDFVFADSGSVSGVVRLAGGAAVANGQVRLTRASPALDVTMNIAPDGGYRFAGLAAGDYSLNATTASRFSPAITATIVAGQTTPADLRLNAIATVRITTVRSDGVTVFPFATIRLTDSGGTLRGTAFTDANGVFTFPSLWEDSWVITAFAAGGLNGSGNVIVGPANDGQLIDVVITMTGPVTGSIRARVLAADGLTPVRFSWVEVYDVATGNQLRTGYTTAAGILDVIATDSGQGIRATAYTPNFAAAVSEVVRLTTAGQTVDINLILPLSVIRGRVFFNDGITPVSFPDAFVQQTNALGNQKTFYAVTSELDGSYTVLGADTGAFIVTAQDGEAGLTASAAGELLSIDQAAVVDVVLPPSGAVAGQVLDADANPVVNAWVGLASDGAGFTRYIQTDLQGRYRFDRVPLGPVSVQACESTFTVCGSVVAASLNVADQEITVNPTLPATGSVTGRVFAADGSPVADAEVIVLSFLYAGPVQSSFQAYTMTDAAGQYSVTAVPAGAVQVTATLYSDQPASGLAEGTVTPGGTATVDVTLGNAFRFGQPALDGANGFRYQVMCTGALGGGSGTVDGSLSGGYYDAYNARVGAAFFPCHVSGRLEESQRQIAIGPTSVGDLTLTRKIFVPADGGFARYLEIVSNPTATARTVDVEIPSVLGRSESNDSVVIVVDPAATNQTFAVTDLDGGCCDPVLAHVFAGPGAAVSATTDFAAGDPRISYRWTVNVPAGESVVLMHFAVQRDIDAVAAAQAQAEALVNLTDPNALAGMTAAERARVLNFVIP